MEPTKLNNKPEGYTPKYSEGLNLQGRWNMRFIEHDNGSVQGIINAVGSAKESQSKPMSRKDVEAWIDSEIKSSIF